ncbi:hypothetical protein [Rhodococcus sp. UNC363MFTsu5.1]|uniref:hypothetical protein n=1 Tax=Rhodococcus sp. UNC363MFTsu5.1 TaxID=1449069 RepID=UPI0004850BFB|nr:hypothetical protein [Rhodococcus sp. UNC363MFTsu5.1]
MSSPMEVGDLSPAARSLALGANGLQELAARAPQLPNAGASTAFVGDVLAALAEAMSQAAAVEASAADTVHVNASSYTESDTNAGQILDRTGQALPGQGGDR